MTEQVTALFDRGLSPDEIAESLGVDVGSVNYALAQRRPAAATPLLTPEEHREMMNIAKSIARNGENQFVQLSAIKFVCDEGLGRRAAKAGTSVTINISDINAQVVDAHKRARAMLSGEAIEV